MHRINKFLVERIKITYPPSELTHFSPRSYLRSASNALRDGFRLFVDDSVPKDVADNDTEDSYLNKLFESNTSKVRKETLFLLNMD